MGLTVLHPAAGSNSDPNDLKCEAITLLLKSSGEEVTTESMASAGLVVEVLGRLALAIAHTR